MKHVFATGLFFVLSLFAKSQTSENNKASFADTVRKYFDYNGLNEVSCTEVPPGIYGLSFRVDRSGIPYDFRCSFDSLVTLKAFLIKAVQASAEKVLLKKRKKRYLQLCYFNIMLWCNSSNDTTHLSKNIYSDLSKLRGAQLSAIEKSFKKSITSIDEYFVLETVSISDYNPNIKRSETGFKNDTNPGSMTKEQMEELIQEVKRKKNKN